MARQLIESLAGPFDPESYHDEYREQLLDLIERKAAGEEIVAEPTVEPPAKVLDLVAALEESLARAGAGTEGKAKPEAEPEKRPKKRAGGPESRPESGGPGGGGRRRVLVDRPAARRAQGAGHPSGRPSGQGSQRTGPAGSPSGNARGWCPCRPPLRITPV